MQLRPSSLSLALAACALSIFSALAIAADGATRSDEDAITYLNGGVGKDERAAMGRASGAYNLRLTFSERNDNEMVPGVHLRVLDASGKQVFALADAGPVTDLRLPPGSYEVVTSLAGKTKKQAVVIAEGEKKALGFHWKRGA